MPGYEVFNPSGTLVLRVSRDEKISEAELRDFALKCAPLNEDGTASDSSKFIIHSLLPDEYDQAIKDQESLGMPRADGTREKISDWAKRMETIAPRPKPVAP